MTTQTNLRCSIVGSLALALALALATLGCGSGQQARRDRDFSTSGSREADQRADQRMAKEAQIKGGNEQGTSLGNAISQKEMTGPKGVPRADEKKTLYDRLGGEGGISAIVEDFVTRAVADPQVNLERKGVKKGGLSIHRGTSMEWQATGQTLVDFKKYIAQFISLKTGGPTVYEGAELKVVTQDLHFTNAEFDAGIGDLKQSMDKLQIPNQEQKELIAIVESTRPQIAESR
jgi:hemoglobin